MQTDMLKAPKPDKRRMHPRDVKPLYDLWWIRRRKKETRAESRRVELLLDVVEALLGPDERYASVSREGRDNTELQLVINVKKNVTIDGRPLKRARKKTR